MRLIHTTKIVVEPFPSPETPNIPDYAILSHRWGAQEISFQEIQNLTPELEKTEGFKKIKRCCQEAALVGFDYVWIDTCCIDQTDQVELTEALNSMFHWYRSAQVCYSYMSDVESTEDPRAKNSKFRANWKEIGTKSSLQELITEITGIPSQVLLMNHGGEISIAQRMSWAAKRETAEVEDKAYCLLGLFNVSMPMIYGEGENAFRRLHLEIMKLSDDQSIFAWANDKQGGKRGLLATSPAEFENCSDVRRLGDSSTFAMTNKGIGLKLPLIPHGKSSDGKKDLMLGVLSCQRKQGPNYPDCFHLAIYLERATEGDFTDYYRVSPGIIREIKIDISKVEKKEVYVRDRHTDRLNFEVSSWMKPEKEYDFYFSYPNRGSRAPQMKYPQGNGATWIFSQSETRFLMAGSGGSGTMIFKDESKQVFAVLVGVHNYNVWCSLTNDCEGEDIKKIARTHWDGNKKSARWNNMDRRTLGLEGGEKVDLAIRKGKKKGRRAYLITISMGESFWLDQVGPGDFPGWW